MLNKLNFSDAVNWWISGLAYLCPTSVRNVFITPPELITIEFNGQDVLFKRYTSDLNEAIETHQFNKSDDVERLRALSWLEKQKEEKAEITLILPDEFFLKKKITFPKAAISNLRQVLSFEMSRKTPFSPEQVYFDFLLHVGNEKTDKIHPELFLVPRERINSELELLESWSIRLDAIRPANYRSNSDINLIAPEYQPNNKSKPDKTMHFLVSTACLLLMAILYAPIVIQQKELAIFESAVAKSRKDAIELQALKQDKDLILEQSNFLENKRRDELSSIALINEVTQIIPDDTWLSRFVMKENELQLQGESSNASSLIQTLESSPFFTNVQFRSPVTQNKISHKDKFNLSATFTREST